MELDKTKFWICDNCGKKIDNIEDGWVECLEAKDENGNYKSWGIRIVHRIGCLYNQDLVYKQHKAIVSDIDLKSLSGSDGLMYLLEKISDNNFKDNEEVLEIIKRIHIPGYEEARLYFDEAIEEGVFEPNTKPSYYSQNDIKAVLDYIRKNRQP